MALGNAALGEVGWSGTQTQRKLPKLPVSSKRKTLTATPVEDGKVRMTYQMSIQRPKGAVEEITEVTLGHVKVLITPTETPGWMQVVVESVVQKP